MKKLLAIAILLGNASLAFAWQCDFRISGHVEDKDSHEKLVNASVRIIELNRQMVTDENGDFEFGGLCAGLYTLEISHVGCETIQQKVQLRRSRHLDIHLPHLKNLMEAVTISGNTGTPNTGYQEKLSGIALEETRGASFSDALARVNGVTLLQTGATIAKPVIHGLHGSRILTINNGLRHEGQQWGSEHAPEIDPFVARELSVIKGVEALRYGSDGIAGVVLMEPASLPLSEGVNGEINTGFFSNNSQFYASASVEQRLKRFPSFAYRVQGSFKRGANIRTPDYRLNNTASRDENFSVATAWRKDKYTIEAYYSNVRASNGIFSGAHIGNLTDLLQAIDSERPAAVYLGEQRYTIERPRQEVAHQLLKLKSTFYSGSSKWQLILGFQENERREFDMTRPSAGNRPQQQLTLRSFSQDLVWEHGKLFNLRGALGISLTQKEHHVQGRYFIPGYSANSVGAFWFERWTKNRLSIQAGFRFDHRGIDTRRLRFGGQEINHDFDFSTLAASGNIRYQLIEGLTANLMVSLANRAPDVSELLSDGIHHGTATYEQGDINLKSERAVNTGFGLSMNSRDKRLSGELFLYNNHIRDFIYRIPLPENPVLTVAGAFPRISFQQTSARLQGLDASLTYKISDAIGLGTQASLLRAFDKSAADWLILMPADRLTQSISFNFPGTTRFIDSYLRIEYRSVLKQHRVPEKPGQPVDYKNAPAAYNLTSLQASTTTKLAHRPVVFGIGINNLFNVRYREYLNSFRYFTDDMGRNIQFRVKILFGQ